MTNSFGTATFCDDIRAEMLNKISLMGIYGYEMLLYGKFPVTLPKLGIFASLRFHKSKKIDGVDFLVYFPGDKEDAPTFSQHIDVKLEHSLFPQPDPKEYPDPSDQFGLNHPFLFSPAVIKQPGYIRVRAIAGGERIKVGALKVREASEAEAQQTRS